MATFITKKVRHLFKTHYALGTFYSVMPKRLKSLIGFFVQSDNTMEFFLFRILLQGIEHKFSSRSRLLVFNTIGYLS